MGSWDLVAYGLFVLVSGSFVHQILKRISGGG